MDVWIKSEELMQLGVDRTTIWRNTKSGKWVARTGKRKGRFGQPQKEVLLSSLPDDLQLQWARLQESLQTADAPDEKPVENDSRSDVENDPHQQHNTSVGWCSPQSSLDRLTTILLRYSPDERQAYLVETLRRQSIIERYDAIHPKRFKHSQTGVEAFVPEVLALCQEAICTDPLIIAREGRRVVPPSPHTLARWSTRYRTEGLLALIRALPDASADPDKEDGRYARLPDAAKEWINKRWRTSAYPLALFHDYCEKAVEQGWPPLSDRWFYRRWHEIPKLVLAKKRYGKKGFNQHLAHVPRDFSDLHALQILCGDHSQRDLSVMLRDGTLTRPWLTTWQDMRTGLIWGWHLDLTPSSYTVGAAYANGVQTFGAQPLSRPDEGFFSYIYTDNGRDYRSKNWDGKVIDVHYHAMDLEGGIEVLRVQRQVGIVDELGIKHLLARGDNAREKPVERYHRVVSDWEQNTFEEYCGRDGKNKPDQWRDLWARHQKLLNAGKAEQSSIIRFEAYREALSGFIHKYNTTAHKRMTLGGAKVIPLDDYRRLYTTRYEIAAESLALLLKKVESRVIKPNGVQFFQQDWSYAHPAMVEFIGQRVEVRFDDHEMERVWVVLPNMKICEASLIPPTSILKANPITYEQVARLQAEARRLDREHQFVDFRGPQRIEAVKQQEERQEEELPKAVGENPQGRVHFLTRMDKPKLRAVDAGEPPAEEVKEEDLDYSIFVPSAPQPDSDFDLESMGEGEE